MDFSKEVAKGRMCNVKASIQAFMDSIVITKKDRLRVRENKEEAISLLKVALERFDQAMLTGLSEDFYSFWSAFHKAKNSNYINHALLSDYRLTKYYYAIVFEIQAIEYYIPCINLDIPEVLRNLP